MKGWALIIIRVGKCKVTQGTLLLFKAQFYCLWTINVWSLPSQLKALYSTVLTSCREGKDEIILVKEDQLWKRRIVHLSRPDSTMILLLSDFLLKFPCFKGTVSWVGAKKKYPPAPVICVLSRERSPCRGHLEIYFLGLLIFTLKI